MAQYSDLYNPRLSRQQFLSGAASLASSLAKATALGGLAAVVAACDGGNPERFSGEVGGKTGDGKDNKKYDYNAWSSTYFIELMNSDGSLYAIFEGSRSDRKHPDILREVKFYDGKSEHVQIFTVYPDGLYGHTDCLSRTSFFERHISKEAKRLFADLKWYHNEAQKDVANKRETTEKKS